MYRSLAFGFTLLLGGFLPAQESTKTQLEELAVKSEALGREVPVVVHLPPGYDPKAKYPVVYFLHGAGRGNHRTWGSRGADDVAREMMVKGTIPPMIVVCPNGARMSFYIDWKGQKNERHGEYLSKELVQFIDSKYGTKGERRYRALLGDSMGGYGALVNALRHPDVFGVTAAHSPSIFPEARDKLPSWVAGGRRGRGSILTRLFGDPIDEAWWLEHNVFHRIRTGDLGKVKDLSIYFDVGKNDEYGLAEPCAQFDKLLKEKGVAHEFHLRDGDHGRGFFMDNVATSLAFIGSRFKAVEDKKPGDEKGN